mmetsp:Transcript_96464/g.281926  ORF Transcript_96464/g.281926 Transcript_96464/m.281926 type:complete len:295 (+) Transcript_96464:604-1488(+)
MVEAATGRGADHLGRPARGAEEQDVARGGDPHKLLWRDSSHLPPMSPAEAGKPCGHFRVGLAAANVRCQRLHPGLALPDALGPELEGAVGGHGADAEDGPGWEALHDGHGIAAAAEAPGLWSTARCCPLGLIPELLNFAIYKVEVQGAKGRWIFRVHVPLELLPAEHEPAALPVAEPAGPGLFHPARLRRQQVCRVCLGTQEVPQAYLLWSWCRGAHRAAPFVVPLAQQVLVWRSGAILLCLIGPILLLLPAAGVRVAGRACLAVLDDEVAPDAAEGPDNLAPVSTTSSALRRT